MLTGVVTGLLVAAWQSETGHLVLVVGALAMAGCCAEMGRLGRFANRGLTAALFVAGTVLVAGLVRDLAAGAPSLHLGWRYFEAAGWAALVAGICVRAKSGTSVIALVLGAAGVAWSLARPEHVDPRWSAGAPAIAALVIALPLLHRPASRERVVEATLASIWLVPPLPGLLFVWWAFAGASMNGAAGLTALVLLSKIGDVFGYYVGNAIGRSHPFPRISPGKTTAGVVGSLVGGVALGGALVPMGLLPDGPLGIVGGLLAGLVVNVAAQAGDLLESRVKRAAGVKDSGPWFGPAGGMLDALDSLLVTIPVALLTWPWILGGL